MQFQAIWEVPFVPVQRSLRQVKLYLFWLAFTLGNVLFPMIVHAVPNGGMIFLPLFFFTLVAAYSEGLLVGMLVAIASPLINHALTGMPMLSMLPVVLFKSLFIALAASMVSQLMKKISMPLIVLMVVAMQGFGGLLDFFISGNVERVLSSLRMGLLGMIIMAFGGFAMLRIIARIRE